MESIIEENILNKTKIKEVELMLSQRGDEQEVWRMLEEKEKEIEAMKRRLEQLENDGKLDESNRS